MAIAAAILGFLVYRLRGEGVFTRLIEEPKDWGRLAVAQCLVIFGIYYIGLIAGEALSKTSRFNPIYSRGDTRSWIDLNGDGRVLNDDGTPQFDEIGRSGNVAFGELAGTCRLDPDLPRDARWVRPELVCAVEYTEVTEAVRLRAPTYQGRRDDVDPRQCLLADLPLRDSR